MPTALSITPCNADVRAVSTNNTIASSMSRICCLVPGYASTQLYRRACVSGILVVFVDCDTLQVMCPQTKGTFGC
jgi:hypothetical protein